jgi:predicted phage-related endonuclease
MKEAQTMSPAELRGTARTYRTIQAEIKELEEQLDFLKQVMIRELDARQADEITAGEFTIRWNLYESNRLDSAKLKAEQPNSTPSIQRTSQVPGSASPKGKPIHNSHYV